MRYAGGIARLDTNVAFGHRQAAIARQYAHGPAPGGGGTPWWEFAGDVAVILYALGTTILLLLRRRAGTARGRPAMIGRGDTPPLGLAA